MNSLIALGLLWLAAVGALPAPTDQPTSTGPAALQTLGGIPLHFEDAGPLKGEVDCFLARGRDHTILLEGNQVEIVFEHGGAARAGKGSSPRLGHPGAASANGEEHSIQLTLLGASSMSLAGFEKLPGVVNYFVGTDPTNWRTQVPLYAKVIGREAYPGIDVVYYGTGERLEFDFIVAPGANPSPIACRVSWARSLNIVPSGDLVIDSGYGELRQHKPVAYQIIDGTRRAVSVAYRLRDSNTFAFEIGAFDVSFPLVIDPILSYSTFFGGEKQDAAWAVKTDAAGNIFFAGETRSQNFRIRATPGAFQTKYAGGRFAAGDGFVAKLNAAGTTFDYITYLGGRDDDGILGMDLDAAGNVYVAGFTDSTNFPVTPGAFQTQNGGTNDPLVNLPFTDAFIAKLDPTGSALIYSTYLGGYGAESANGIAVDAAGQAHVAGFTDSGTVFLTTNLICSTTCTNRVCGPTTCITNADYTGSPVPGVTVTNVTFITNGMTIDVVETFIETTPLDVSQVSVGFPVVNPIQPNNGGIFSYKAGRKLNYVATNDAFVSTLSADGSSLVYSTYLGGTSADAATGIALDAAGQAVITGWTDSINFPVANAIQRLNLAFQNAFVTKFNSTGDALIFSTYLGGSGLSFGAQVALDSSESIYVVGFKTGASFPSTPRAFNRGGIFKSADAGAFWLQSDDGIQHPQVQALALDYNDTMTIYAGTDRGVFRTTDGGLTWRNRDFGITNLIVNALAIDPFVPTRVYAGTVGALYRSLDGGAIWLNSSSNLNNEHVTALAIDPVDPATIYCGTRHGVFKSTNGAAFWNKSSDGVGNSFVNALVVHPTNTAFVFAGTEGGVYKTTNAAAKWQARNHGLGATRVKALALDPVGVETLYAATTRGVYKSTNGAEDWFLLTNGMGKQFVTSLAIDPSMPAIVYAGTTNGVFLTTNAGLSWTGVTNGLHPRRVASLALDATTNPLTLYAGMLGTNSFGGTNDVFLTKLSADGQRMEYSLAMGGSKNDQGFAIAVDSQGRAYLTGVSDSPNFPVVLAPTNMQSKLAGRTDAIVVQFNEDGSLPRYSFYLGGGSTDSGLAIALDPLENAYVAGNTYSGSFPKTTNAVQRTISGSSDAFVTRITPSVPRPPPCP